MQRWFQVLLLVTAAVVCLGTSKRLLGKKLTKPKIHATEGVTLIGEPLALLKENTNNQGCFASQRVDFVLRAQVRNVSKHALSTQPNNVRLTMGFESKQKEYSVTEAFFRVRDAQGLFRRSATLAPNAKGTLHVSARSILAKKAAAKVRWLRLIVNLSSATLQLEYRDIQNLKLENVR